MPAQPFTVHADQDEPARPDLTAAITTPSTPDRPASGAPEHHGAADGKLAARQRSERARASRAGSQGQGGRSYAFRRS